MLKRKSDDVFNRFLTAIRYITKRMAVLVIRKLALMVSGVAGIL